MTNIDEQIESVEISMDLAKKVVTRRDMLLRLYSNKDFEQLISEEYFTNEASRLVLIKADPDMQTKDKQKGIERSMVGIGALRQYFQVIMQQGNMAERALLADAETHEELLQEAAH